MPLLTALLTSAVEVSVVADLATLRLRRKWLILAAAASYILFGMAPNTYILVVGDQMPQDTRLAAGKELKRAAKTVQQHALSYEPLRAAR